MGDEAGVSGEGSEAMMLPQNWSKISVLVPATLAKRIQRRPWQSMARMIVHFSPWPYLPGFRTATPEYALP